MPTSIILLFLLVEIKNGMPERAQFIENVFDATYKHTYQLLTREF